MAWRRRDPAALAGLLALVGAAVAVLALRLLVWHTAERCAPIGLVKPSGHSAMAAAVYGTIGFVYGRDWPAARILCGALIVGVPVAMVALGFHSVPDVVVGGLAGLAALNGGRALAGLWRRPRRAA